MALRGLRPIAEIQYFDYILYALQTLSDDLAVITSYSIHYTKLYDPNDVFTVFDTAK